MMSKLRNILFLISLVTTYVHAARCECTGELTDDKGNDCSTQWDSDGFWCYVDGSSCAQRGVDVSPNESSYGVCDYRYGFLPMINGDSLVSATLTTSDVATVNECLDICDSDITCTQALYKTSESLCYNYNSTSEISHTDSNVDFKYYMKCSTQFGAGCKECSLNACVTWADYVPGYDFVRNRNTAESPLATHSNIETIKDCAALCDAASACTNILYREDLEECCTFDEALYISSVYTSEAVEAAEGDPTYVNHLYHQYIKCDLVYDSHCSGCYKGACIACEEGWILEGDTCVETAGRCPSDMWEDGFIIANCGPEHHTSTVTAITNDLVYLGMVQENTHEFQINVIADFDFELIFELNANSVGRCHIGGSECENSPDGQFEDTDGTGVNVTYTGTEAHFMGKITDDLDIYIRTFDIGSTDGVLTVEYSWDGIETCNAPNLGCVSCLYGNGDDPCLENCVCDGSANPVCDTVNRDCTSDYLKTCSADCMHGVDPLEQACGTGVCVDFSPDSCTDGACPNEDTLSVMEVTEDKCCDYADLICGSNEEQDCNKYDVSNSDTVDGCRTLCNQDSGCTGFYFGKTEDFWNECLLVTSCRREHACENFNFYNADLQMEGYSTTALYSTTYGTQDPINVTPNVISKQACADICTANDDCTQFHYIAFPEICYEYDGDTTVELNTENIDTMYHFHRKMSQYESDCLEANHENCTLHLGWDYSDFSEECNAACDGNFTRTATCNSGNDADCAGITQLPLNESCTTDVTCSEWGYCLCPGGIQNREATCEGDETYCESLLEDVELSRPCICSNKGSTIVIAIVICVFVAMGTYGGYMMFGGGADVPRPRPPAAGAAGGQTAATAAANTAAAPNTAGAQPTAAAAANTATA